jgi:DNA polymerase III delta subunit
VATKRSQRWSGELQRRLSKSAPREAYAFCGPEHLLKQEARQTLLTALLGREAEESRARYALMTCQIGEQPTSEILGAAAQVGLFGGERLLWVEGVERMGRLGAKDREAWLAALKGDPANPIVLVSTELSHELRKRTKFHAELLDRVTTVDFWPLGDPEAAAWLIERAGRRGVRMSHAAAGYIVSRLGPDLLSLGQEAEKISLLRGEGALGVEDLRELTRQGLLGHSWECVDAALTGRHREALERLQAVRRDETAFSFNWKLTFTAGRWLGTQPATRGGFDGGRAAPPLTPQFKNLLGRVLTECYDWERYMKSGRWSGSHDFAALEAMLVAHAVRARRGHPGGEQARRGAACRG